MVRPTWQYRKCLLIKNESKVKVVEDDIVECLKCGTSLLLSRFPFNQMAKEGPDTTFVTFVVYNDLIKAIADQDQQITISLLSG